MRATQQSTLALITLPGIARRAGVRGMVAWRRFKASGVIPDAIVVLDRAGREIPCFTPMRELQIRTIITTNRNQNAAKA